MKFLKQSTAAVIVFGPGLLPADGVTLVTSLVTALDHASTGIFLHKNGGAGTIRHATVTATTYDSYGNYLVTLDTTDTNTLGRLRVMFAAAANTLPIWEDFTVLPANVFDSLVSGSSDLKVDVDQIKTQAVTCAAGVTVLASVGTAATSTAQTGDNYARLGAPAGASVSADVAAVKVDTAAVKVQTDKLTFTVANQVDSNVLDWKSATAPAMTGDAFARLGAPAGASVSADTAAVKVDTAAVKVQTDKLTFTVANQVDSNVLDWKSATAPAMTGDSFARLGAAGAGLTALGDTRIANLDATISSRTKPADTQAAVTLVTTTTNLTTNNDKTGYALTSGERNSTADAVLARTLGTESYAADGSVPTLAQALFALISATMEFSISGTTISAKKLDGSTTSMTFTMNDATSPTSRTRTT